MLDPASSDDDGITPEMLAAGVSIVLASGDEWTNPELRAALIYRAMRIAKTSKQSPEVLAGELWSAESTRGSCSDEEDHIRCLSL